MQKKIATPIDILSWDYYQYVKEHPVKKWNAQTKLLYGGKDNMQSFDIIERFVQAHKCQLTLASDSGHSFIGAGDKKILNTWLKTNL